MITKFSLPLFMYLITVPLELNHDQCCTYIMEYACPIWTWHLHTTKNVTSWSVFSDKMPIGFLAHSNGFCPPTIGASPQMIACMNWNGLLSNPSMSCYFSIILPIANFWHSAGICTFPFLSFTVLLSIQTVASSINWYHYTWNTIPYAILLITQPNTYSALPSIVFLTALIKFCMVFDC